MGSSSFNNGYKVKEAVRELVRSGKIAPMLERFHSRLDDMDIGFSISSGRVSIKHTKGTEAGAAAELLLGHIFKELSFESSFEIEIMQRAARLGGELTSLGKEFFTSVEFLSVFTEMLRESRNSDDLGSLAGLCLNVFSANGSNMRLASIGEVSNPELVIEMTKSFASLMLSMRTSAVPQPPHAAPQEPAAADSGPQHAEDAREQGPPDVMPIPEVQPSPIAGQDSEQAPRAVTLDGRLVELGISPRLAAEYAKGYSDSESALMVLEGYARVWGEGITMMAVCRNRLALLGGHVIDKMLSQYSTRLGIVSKKEGVLKKYSAVTEALRARLGFDDDQCMVSAESLAYQNSEPVQVMSNLELVLSNLPHDVAKMVVLGNPRMLGRQKDVRSTVSRLQKDIADMERNAPREAEAPKAPRAPASPTTFEQRMLDIGVTRDYLDEILESPRYNANLPQCLENLDAFISEHGETLTLMALHKNRGLLIGTIGERALANMKKEIREIEKDEELRTKFAGFTELVVRELEVPEMAVYPALHTLKKGMRPEMVIENFQLLLERLPKEKLRRVLFGSPSRLVLIREIDILLSEHSAKVPEIDEDKLVADLLKAMGDKRPEAFIRAYVRENLFTVASRSLENVVVKIEFAARNLQTRATVQNIPKGYVQECIESGIIDFDAIKTSYEEMQTLKDVTPEKALQMLEAKMLELGAEQEYARELLEVPCYRERPGSCLIRLNAIVRDHGPGMALILLYKNRSALAGSVSETTLKEITRGLRRVRKGKALEKYAKIVEALQTELGLPEEAAYFVISKVHKGSEDTLLEDLQLLIARLPKERVRSILLKSPHVLSSRPNLEAILAECGPTEAIDAEKVVTAVLALAGGERPEAFIRAVVEANAQMFAFQSPERAWKYVEYKARVLQAQGTSKGIPSDFVQDCIARGVIDFETIQKEFEGQPRNDASESGGRPASPPPQHMAEEAAEEAAPAIGDAQSPSPPPIVPRLDEPLVEGIPESGAEPAPVETMHTEKIRALLAEYSINNGIADDILKRSEACSSPDLVLSRLSSALSLFVQCAPSACRVTPFSRDFFNARKPRDALFDLESDEFDDLVIDAAERLSESAKPSSSPPRSGNGKTNGLVHIRIPTGDIPLFDRIKTFEMPMDIQAYIESRGLDPHEFAYAVLKIFRWITNRVPQSQKQSVFRQNVSRVADDAQSELMKVLGRMIKEVPHSRESHQSMKGESEMDEPSREVFRMLKQLRSHID